MGNVQFIKNTSCWRTINVKVRILLGFKTFATTEISRHETVNCIFYILKTGITQQTDKSLAWNSYIRNGEVVTLVTFEPVVHEAGGKKLPDLPHLI